MGFGDFLANFGSGQTPSFLPSNNTGSYGTAMGGGPMRPDLTPGDYFHAAATGDYSNLFHPQPSGNQAPAPVRGTASFNPSDLMQMVNNMDTTPYPLKPEENIFFNKGFFGQHPTFTRGLEGALMTVGGMGDPHTPGEAISGIARGLMGYGQAKQQHEIQQLLAPIQWQQQQRAANISNLKNLADMYEQIGRGNYYNQGGRAMAPRGMQRQVDADGNVWMVDTSTGEAQPLQTPGGGQMLDKSVGDKADRNDRAAAKQRGTFGDYINRWEKDNGRPATADELVKLKTDFEASIAGGKAKAQAPYRKPAGGAGADKSLQRDLANVEKDKQNDIMRLEAQTSFENNQGGMKNPYFKGTPEGQAYYNNQMKQIQQKYESRIATRKNQASSGGQAGGPPKTAADYLSKLQGK